MRIFRRVLHASLLAASGLFPACVANPERASYGVPHSGVTLVVERTPARARLAEYRRSAHLDIAGQAVARTDLFLDTGGYSRINLYRSGDTTLLMRDADASYVVDVHARTIAKDGARRRAGTFVGSFDVDSSGIWRFLPSTERAELPTEFSRGSSP